jgi:nitric oxide reductase activation protein
MLNDSQKKKIRDVAIGHVVDSKLSIEDQIAAIRKQLVALSEALKVPLAPDFQALEDLVASEKAKKEEKKATTKAKA